MFSTDSHMSLERLGLVVHGLAPANKSCMAQLGGSGDNNRFQYAML
jgi:hypothetical protein